MTTSEKRLAGLLGLVVVLLVLVFGVVFYLRGKDAMLQDMESLRNARLEADLWLEERALWEDRRQWVMENMPDLPPDGSAASALLQDMQKTAEECGLKITSQSLTEPVPGELFEEYSIQLRVNGTLEQLAKWLSMIQSPESFQAIKAFNLQSNKAEPTAVVCELQVTRFYKPQNNT